VNSRAGRTMVPQLLTRMKIFNITMYVVNVIIVRVNMFSSFSGENVFPDSE